MGKINHWLSNYFGFSFSVLGDDLNTASEKGFYMVSNTSTIYVRIVNPSDETMDSLLHLKIVGNVSFYDKTSIEFYMESPIHE